MAVMVPLTAPLAMLSMLPNLTRAAASIPPSNAIASSRLELAARRSTGRSVLPAFPFRRDALARRPPPMAACQRVALRASIKPQLVQNQT